MRQITPAKSAEVGRTWHAVDGTGKTLGRLVIEVASVLRGKHKPTHTPNVNCGDFVVVINADKIGLTGNKLDTKKYYNHFGHAGRLRIRTARVMKDNHMVEWVERVIYDMPPHIKLGDKMRRHLLVCESSEHPHIAQRPVKLKVKG